LNFKKAEIASKKNKNVNRNHILIWTKKLVSHKEIFERMYLLAMSRE
jgi:hypothetical protein